MENLSFKVVSSHLPLCILLSLLWSADSQTTETVTSSVPDTIETTVPETTPPMTTTPTTTKTPVGNVVNVMVLNQTESSITLKWDKVAAISTYSLQYFQEGSLKEESINASEAGPAVLHVADSLSPGTKYNFTLFTISEGGNSSGYTFFAVTVPLNTNEFKSISQNDTSITLQWRKVEDILNYTLVFNGEDINITASQGPEVHHTIPNLTSGTRYNFTLFTVFEGVRSRGVSLSAVTAPLDAEDFKSISQNDTSITLQWRKVEDILNYTLVFNGEDINITASQGPEVHHTIPNLTSGTRYNFTLFTVFEGVRSRGVSLSAVTAPLDAEDFKSISQNDTSITLQWRKVEDILNYTLVFNGEDINITASQGPEVHHTIPNLTSGTRYNFTLFTVFEGVRSRGVSLSAVTAPLDAEDFKSISQNDTSITLQWRKVEDILNYTLVFNGEDINITASQGPEVHHTIPNLTSGTRYNFTLFTVFEGVRSRGVSLSAVTAPLDAEDFKSISQNDTSITLQWRKVEDILNYTLVFNGEDINITASQGPEVHHTIPNLTSGTRYNFTLFTVFEGVRSRGVSLSAVTAPDNVKKVEVVTQNTSSITLLWDKVDKMSTYILQYGNQSIEIQDRISTSKLFIIYEVSPLTAGTKYSFTLTTVFERVNSTGFSFDAATVPAMVALVNVTERSESSVTLVWENMDNNWSYFLQINDETVTVKPSSDIVSHTARRLQPGTEYPFNLITVFSGLNSTVFTGSTLTVINCASVAWHVTNSSIQGVVDGLFSSATASNGSQTNTSPGGRNVSFTGLYAGATYTVSLIYENNSTYEVQCSHILTITPPDLRAHCESWAGAYSIFIIWDKPDGVWTDVEVNVTDETYMVKAEEERHLKISGFQPARTYKVSLTSLSGSVRNHKPYVFQCSTDPRGVIAGSVLSVLLFVILICAAVFILLKRPDIISRKKSFIWGVKRSAKKPRSIPVAKFPEHFNQLNADEHRGFILEYESLAPIGMEQTRNIADLPENRRRNRFTNVLPYDWCRVKLSNLSVTSDYINASYIPGYNSTHEYIATQGPLPSTVNDFWRMIWEQRVKRIVMVTNCNEGGRTKCECYWPSHGHPGLHGELVVTFVSEQEEQHWTLREFRMKHSDMSEERIVKHFHFTAWPDHGVPQGTNILIQFRQLVRHHIEQEEAEAPTVVHCSAGVGRTGTIIALDVLLQQLDREKQVGIHTFVHKMRLRRPYMVQTKCQYVFLHQCIMDCLATDTTEENIYENDNMIYVNATALREFHRGEN